MTTERQKALGGDEADAIGAVNPDHAPKLLEGEPAAWRVTEKASGNIHLHHAEPPVSRDLFEVQPLYAHPAPIDAGLREKVAAFLSERDEAIRGDAPDAGEIEASAEAILDILSALQSEGADK